MPIANLRGDSSSAWLVDGMQQMLAADLARGLLARTGAMSVVDPALLRDAARTAGIRNPAALAGSEAGKLARSVGANMVVTGSITRGGDVSRAADAGAKTGGSRTGRGAAADIYVVGLSLRRITDSEPLELFTVTGTDVVTIAERAAARILARATADAGGPQFAEIETDNVAAYQRFIRALQAEEEGRTADVNRELDAAIALDSGFVSAIIERIRSGGWSDSVTVKRLTPLLVKAGGRIGERDRLDLAASAAEHNGEHDRAETLARQLLKAFPRDPRSYVVLTAMLIDHGKWAAADSVYVRLLSLDSLGRSSAAGPCVPCWVYHGRASMLFTLGDLGRDETVARRWIALQPDLPGAWNQLTALLAGEGRYAEALDAAKHAVELSSDDPDYVRQLGIIHLMARDYAAVDSIAAQWQRSDLPVLREDAADLLAMKERELGQLRASNATFAAIIHSAPAMRLVVANSLARLGQRMVAARMYENIFIARAGTGPPSPVQPLVGDEARAYAWHRALEADALGATWPGDAPPNVDTAALRIIADSIELVSRRSYYGRDWRLAHHVRGLIAMAGARPGDAVRELRQAQWGAAGWTATNVALAQAFLALQRPDSALAVVRATYHAPLDAMGRYVPRSDLDFLMAVAFDRLGEGDSSAVYAGYVRRAWSEADPEVRRRLTALPSRVASASPHH